MTDRIVVKKKCKIVFNFDAKESDQISVNVGQVIYIVDDTNEEWWKGILASTRATGFVPKKYLEDITHWDQRVVVTYDYEPESENEIVAYAGDVLLVKDTNPGEEWWEVERNGRVGFIPTTFVTVVKSELDIINAKLNAKTESSTPQSEEGKRVHKQIETTLVNFESELHQYFQSFIGNLENALNPSGNTDNSLYEIEKLKLLLREKERKIESLQKQTPDIPTSPRPRLIEEHSRSVPDFKVDKAKSKTMSHDPVEDTVQYKSAKQFWKTIGTKNKNYN